MVGYSSDTCSVLFGVNNSVTTILRARVPHILTIKCGCHMVNLCFSYASMQLPEHSEDLIRNITNHFSNAPKAIRGLSEIQDAIKLASLKPGQTCWLTKEPCVKSIIQQLHALLSCYKTFVVNDKCSNYTYTLSSLEGRITIIYFEFLGYALGFFNTELNFCQSN